MIFRPTAIAGVVVVELERVKDERGWFARSFCADEFAQAGLRTEFPQQNISRSMRRGTVRGLHVQVEPYAEAKLVRCTAGAAFDVAVDVRPGSPTYGRWVSADLTAKNGRAFYIAEGCAHGFVTLADDTDMAYLMSAEYQPSAARTIRWDDPAIGIAWPIVEPSMVGLRDTAAPTLAEFAATLS